MYTVVQLSRDLLDFPEQLGTKSKWWFRGASGAKILYKIGRLGTGENWAEKVASELASLLQIPHAHYELAECDGQKGVVSDNIVPNHGRLIPGNEILGKNIEGYDGAYKYKQRLHTVRTVSAILKGVSPPPGCMNPIVNGRDAFIGYLMFDAWIGNQDRHAENWGLIRSSSGIYLAPTFDHASSLGRNESDEVRLERLKTKDVRRAVPYYVGRARSALYGSANDEKPLTTICAFTESAKFSNSSAEHWMGKLRGVKDSEIDDCFRKFPEGWISDAAIEFSKEILRENRRRILESVRGEK